MSRRPPPNAGTRSAAPAARSRRVSSNAATKIDGAADRRRDRRVGVQADEQIGLVVVGHRRPLVDRHVAVVVSRQQHADAEPRFDGALDASRDRQRQVFFLRPAGALRALVFAAVAGIDRDRADRRRGWPNAGGSSGRRWRRSVAGGAGAARSVPAATDRSTSRIVLSDRLRWPP